MMFKACLAFGHGELSVHAFKNILMHHGYWDVLLNGGQLKYFVLLCGGC